MDGIHDMGGRFGYGPINPEPNEPVFHADWERSVLTMFPAVALTGAFNVDSFRHSMERIDPADYITSTYYEHWLHAVEDLGVKAGIIDPDELDRRTQHYLENPDEELPSSQDTDLKATLETILPGGLSCMRESDKRARFKVGDKVRVVTGSPRGHTRRQSYVRGKVGEVVLSHGTYVLPDTNAHGEGENPEHVYTVRYTANEIWGADGVDPNMSIYTDAWDSYLEPA